MTYKKGLLLSLSHATLISAPHISPFTLNFKTLNQYILLTVIQPLLLIIASELFSTKYSRLNHFIPALKRFFSFAFHTQASMVYKYAHTTSQITFKSLYPYIFISFVFRSTCRLSDFFPFKDRIPFAMISHVVYKYKFQCCGALHACMLIKHADIYTRESQNIWEFRLKLETSFQSHNCLLF